MSVFYLFCAKRMPRIYALCASFLFAFNPHLTNFAGNEIISDIPFLLFAFVCIMTLGVLFDDKNRLKSAISPYIFAILGGISMAFASAIRTNGLVILCALLCVHFVLLFKHFTPKIPKKFTQNRLVKSLLEPFKSLCSPYNFKVIFAFILPFVWFMALFLRYFQVARAMCICK